LLLKRCKRGRKERAEGYKREVRGLGVVKAVER